VRNNYRYARVTVVETYELQIILWRERERERERERYITAAFDGVNVK